MRVRILVVGFILAAGVVGGAVWWGSRPDSMRVEALKAASEGRFAEAEPLLKSALASKPEDAEVAEALARGYLKSDTPDQAEIYLSRWVELRPNDPKAHRLRFEFYRRGKNLEKAYPEGRKLLELEPADRQLRRVLMGQAFSLGLFEDAETLCRECLREKPNDRGLRSLLAECRRARGDGTGAGEILDRLLQDFPTDTPAMMARAILFLETGLPEKAVPLLRGVFKTDRSRQRTAGYHLAIALERTGQVEEAKEVTAEVRRMQDVANAEEAIRNQPDNLELRVRLGESLLNAGHTQDGLRMIEETLSRDPGFAPAHLALAAYYDRNSDPTRAAEHRRRAGSVNRVVP